MERDPRWGRNQEAPGEDPHLTSKYIAGYVRGLQEGEDPDSVQMVATCKHFIANSLEHSTIDGKVITRHNFDAEISLPELTDYYMPGFKACVQEGRGLGIMCSYNAVNGVPMCANQKLLTDVLRGQWGFDGYVTSDCGAIADIYKNHQWPPNPADPPNAVVAAAAGLKAGCDTDCGGVYGSSVVEAVNRSILSEATVDASLQRLTKIQMRVGLFAPKTDQIYFDASKYGIEQIDTPAHQALAMEAALQSIVLLKNEKSTLPLKAGSKIALVGPHVDGRQVFLSNYHGARCTDGYACIPSPTEAVTAANSGGTTTSTKGVDIASSANNISAAVAAAEAADVVVLLVGIDGSQEGEEHDRSNCTLPGLQSELVEAVTRVGKPTVMVLINGGAMCLGPVKAMAPAIVEAFYGGESGAMALAAVLFGHYNPTGKLPVTMYPPHYMTDIPLTQMSVSAPPGRTHLHYTGTPDFAFGSGLSYSVWTTELLEERSAGSVEEASVSPTASEPTGRGAQTHSLAVAGGTLHWKVRVTNKGPLPGAQRVLAFARPREIGKVVKGTPRQRLWAYQPVKNLAVGESTTVDFTLRAADLATSDAKGDRVVTPGEEYVLAFSDGEKEVTTHVRLTGEAPVIVEASVYGH